MSVQEIRDGGDPTTRCECRLSRASLPPRGERIFRLERWYFEHVFETVIDAIGTVALSPAPEILDVRYTEADVRLADLVAHGRGPDEALPGDYGDDECNGGARRLIGRPENAAMPRGGRTTRGNEFVRCGPRLSKRR